MFRVNYPKIICILCGGDCIKNQVEIPKFENETQLRDYLINITLELVVNLKEQALKKGNVRKAPISNAKMGQYRVALESIKILNNILKDKEITQLNLKMQNLERGLLAVKNTNENDCFELSPEIRRELERVEVVMREGL